MNNKGANMCIFTVLKKTFNEITVLLNCPITSIEQCRFLKVTLHSHHLLKYGTYHTSYQHISRIHSGIVLFSLPPGCLTPENVV